MTEFPFEWDPEKARSNYSKHRITFAEAATVFSDSLALTISDPLHSADEDRFIIIGESEQKHLLVVSYTERGDNIRIISARKAEQTERRTYEQGT